MTGLQLGLLLIACFCQIDGQETSTRIRMDLVREQTTLKNNVSDNKSSKFVGDIVTTTLAANTEIESGEETSTQDPQITTGMFDSSDENFEYSEVMDEGLDLTTDSSLSTNLYTVSVNDVFSDKVNTKLPGEDYKGISIIKDWLKNEQTMLDYTTTEINSFTDYDYSFTDISMETTDATTTNHVVNLKELEEIAQKSNKSENFDEIIQEIVNDVYKEALAKNTEKHTTENSTKTQETSTATSPKFITETNEDFVSTLATEVSTETIEDQTTVEIEESHSYIPTEVSLKTNEVNVATTEIIEELKIEENIPTEFSNENNISTTETIDEQGTEVEIEESSLNVATEDYNETADVNFATTAKIQEQTTEAYIEESSSTVPTEVSTKTNEVTVGTTITIKQQIDENSTYVPNESTEINAVTTEVIKEQTIETNDFSIDNEKIRSNIPTEVSTKTNDFTIDNEEIRSNLPIEVSTDVSTSETIEENIQVEIEEIGSNVSTEASTNTNERINVLTTANIEEQSTEIYSEESTSIVSTGVSTKNNDINIVTTEKIEEQTTDYKIEESSSNVPTDVSTTNNEIYVVTTQTNEQQTNEVKISSNVDTEVSTKTNEVNSVVTETIKEQTSKVKIQENTSAVPFEVFNKITEAVSTKMFEEETTEMKIEEVSSTTVQPEVIFTTILTTENVETEILNEEISTTENSEAIEVASTISSISHQVVTAKTTEKNVAPTFNETSPIVAKNEETSLFEDNQFLQTTEISPTESLQTSSIFEELATFTTEEITQQTSTSDAYVNQFTKEISKEIIREDFIEQIAMTEENKIEKTPSKISNEVEDGSDVFLTSTEDFTAESSQKSEEVEEISPTTTQETTQTFVTEILISSTQNLQETTTELKKEILVKESGASKGETDKKIIEVLKELEEKIENFNEENLKEIDGRVEALAGENSEEIEEEIREIVKEESTTDFEVVETFNQVSSGLESVNIAQETSAEKKIREEGEVEETEDLFESEDIVETDNATDKLGGVNITEEDTALEEIEKDIEEDSKKAEIAKEDSLDYDDPRAIDEEEIDENLTPTSPATIAEENGISQETDEASYEETLQKETSTLKIETTTDSNMYTNPYLEYINSEEGSEATETEQIDGIVQKVKNFVEVEARTTTEFVEVTTEEIEETVEDLVGVVDEGIASEEIDGIAKNVVEVQTRTTTEFGGVTTEEMEETEEVLVGVGSKEIDGTVKNVVEVVTFEGTIEDYEESEEDLVGSVSTTESVETSTEEIDGIVKNVKNIIEAEAATTTELVEETNEEIEASAEDLDVVSTTEILEVTAQIKDQDKVAAMNVNLKNLAHVNRTKVVYVPTTSASEEDSEKSSPSYVYSVLDNMKKMFGWRFGSTTESIKEVEEEENEDEEIEEEEEVEEESKATEEEIGDGKKSQIVEQNIVEETSSNEEIEEDLEKDSITEDNSEEEDEEKTETDKEMEDEIEAAIEESSIYKEEEISSESTPTVEASTNSQDIHLVYTKSADATTYSYRATIESQSLEETEEMGSDSLEDFVVDEADLETTQRNLEATREKMEQITNEKLDKVFDLEEEIEEDIKKIDEDLKQVDENVPENLVAVMKDENGENCLKINATIAINVNNVRIHLPASARVFGNCSKFVVFSWKPEFPSATNNSVSFTFKRAPDYIQVDYMQLNIQPDDRHAKITEEFKYFDKIGIIDEDIVYGNGLSVRLGLSLKQINNHSGKPTSLESSNTLALQIASGSVTCIVVLTIIGIIVYKRLRSETRIFKVSLDK